MLLDCAYIKKTLFRDTVSRCSEECLCGSWMSYAIWKSYTSETFYETLAFPVDWFHCIVSF